MCNSTDKHSQSSWKNWRITEKCVDGRKEDQNPAGQKTNPVTPCLAFDEVGWAPKDWGSPTCPAFLCAPREASVLAWLCSNSVTTPSFRQRMVFGLCDILGFQLQLWLNFPSITQRPLRVFLQGLHPCAQLITEAVTQDPLIPQSSTPLKAVLCEWWCKVLLLPVWDSSWCPETTHALDHS